jgi:hypothetical protein
VGIVIARTLVKLYIVYAYSDIRILVGIVIARIVD